MPRFGRIAIVGIPAFLFALSCYNPNISSGSYACGSDGGCPDKFHCASNHICYQGDASIDVPPVCSSVTTVQPIASASCTGAAASARCSPICQTGCNNCGWCALAGGAATCLTGTAGTKDVGKTCDPTKTSDCLPGLYCQAETCGAVSNGICYRICDPSQTKNGVNPACGAMSTCNVAAKNGGGFTLCSPICDPLSQTNVNCPAPFACYPSGATTTECDCAGTGATGDPCSFASMCAQGETCAGPSGAFTCRPICTAVVPCTSGTCNIPNGAVSGTCM